MGWRNVALTLSIVIIVGCSLDRGERMHRQFQHIADEFIRAWLQVHPSSASWLGFHEFDGWVEDYRAEAVEAEVHRLKETLKRLDELDPLRLSQADYSDYQVLRNQILSELLEYEEIQSWRKNPMHYAVRFDVSGYVKRNYAPLEDRLRAVIAKEKKFGQIVEVAKQNLVKQTARTFVSTAIDMAQGQVVFLKSSLPELIRSVGDDTLKEEFESSNDRAIGFVEEFVRYLKQELLPAANNDFAIGTEPFRKMLLYGEMVDQPLDDLLQRGLDDLQRTQEAYRAVAAQVDPSKTPAQVLRKIADDHPTAEGLIPDGAKTLQELRKFLIDHAIVTVPDTANLQVRESLPFERWAFASLDPPGLFETKSTEAFYYITPVESTWSAKQKEEWLRAFNYPVLKIISIHEAYPGHYLHFLRYRTVPSKVARVFGSYSAIEGWAHYTEQMMIDEGYGDGDPVIRLAQLHEALIRLCRYVVAIRMHALGMSVDEATRFFKENAFMEEHPARKEAERGTFDPGYLNYTLGKRQLLELRQELSSREGGHFSLRKFHDEILLHGALPVPLLREMLLD
ncbi:MAG TPA: DUF885 domain-containing protein [Bacteroidota bacterium]